MLEPAVLSKLRNPQVKNILMVGCGGGFDFIHGMLLYPTIQELGKNLVIGSYSFGLIEKLPEESRTTYSQGGVEVRGITPGLDGDIHYAPEVNLANFLATKTENIPPIYAYYARDFTVSNLQAFYTELCMKHSIDLVIAIDGGSDSLMKGDEAGLGDIVEDLVSITALSKLPDEIQTVLCVIGMGVDRFNDVSDASALRAVSDLTKAAAVLGSLGISPGSTEHVFYRECIDYIYQHQTKKSLVANFILAAIEGYYGNENTDLLSTDSKANNYYIWPLMSTLWFFDLKRVALRSDIPAVIEHCKSVSDTWKAVTRYRQSIRQKLLPVENIPRHGDMRSKEIYNFTTGQIEGGFFDEIIEEI